MKLAIMQPYFFPYIGYWQLIHASDCFILLDDVQYMRHGWINRNRILRPKNSNEKSVNFQYIIAPLNKHSHKVAIRELTVCNLKDWRKLILGQIEHYKKDAPYFKITQELIRSALYETTDHRIAYINFAIVQHLSMALCMDCKILLSSELDYDYSDVNDPGDWALKITEKMKASTYINPIGGAELFDVSKFENIRAKISFLRSQTPSYPQNRQTFEASLSIIDVLMFNGIENTRLLLQQYDVIGLANE